MGSCRSQRSEPSWKIFQALSLNDRKEMASYPVMFAVSTDDLHVLKTVDEITNLFNFLVEDSEEAKALRLSV